MATLPTDGTPLKELKHDAASGYFKAFIIAFAVMGIYLAIILISSPGSAKEQKKSEPVTKEAKP